MCSLQIWDVKVSSFSASFVFAVAVGGQRSVQPPCEWGLREEIVLEKLASLQQHESSSDDDVSSHLFSPL